ncbi:MAG: dihydropteroate synthase [Halieaceae bacterium]|jgi:dihydropteroate synthase
MTSVIATPVPALDCAGRILDLSRPQVMGVINTTPDSFSDGGSLYRAGKLNLERAMERARAMVDAGAAILDVGGESTRPGADTVSLDQELARVIPLMTAISAELDVIISIDTSSPQVMLAAGVAGAGIINDVRALSREGALEAAASSGLPICLMHMQGVPDTMQKAPAYHDVVDEVKSFLMAAVQRCQQAGIGSERILIDPGIGFGKSVTHNLQLLGGLSELVATGQPVVVGFSRKSMIGKLLKRDMDQRLPASLALAVLAVERGASIIRTHDVAETVDAVAMSVALRELGG